MRLPSVHCNQLRLLKLVIFASVMASTPVVNGQVRTKKPDRGVYRPPVVLSNVDVVDITSSEDDSATGPERVSDAVARPSIVRKNAVVKQVGYETYSEPIYSGEVYSGEQGAIQYFDEPSCGIESCDSAGCDSISCHAGAPWANSHLGFTSDRWFGSIELLLMFRSGDYPPPLLTTGPADADNPGQLGDPGTRTLVGGEEILADMTAGGRLTIGTWLDDCRSRSLVIRGWLAGEESFNFDANQSTTSIITRPFLNVTTGEVAQQDTQIIATPGFTTFGAVNINASSEVYGADLSIRQHLYSRFGGTIDALYGYQFMRMNENLSISSTSTAGADNPLPLGSTIAISDFFGAENEFHGGQLGLATRYREGCWSFRSLWKVAFGQLSRQAERIGRTEIANGPVVTEPNGLLVRSTNAGTMTDHTFSWVPELDLSLGWHQFPNFDVTFGYHVIAITDAIQTSGLIDPELASNLATPVEEPFRPSPEMRDKTFYVHGLHFGLEYVY